MTSVDRMFQRNFEILLSNASGIRDGNAGAVHDARIATRRLRALLPIALASLAEPQRDAAATTLRRIGRTLGAVRDVDVSLEQLDGLELRLPSASRAIASLRLMLLARQEAARRRMIKRLERVSFDELESARRQFGSRVLFTRTSASQARAAAETLDRRAQQLRDRVGRAGGVYFPNRTHAVRIAAKKLRYLLEFMLEGAERKRVLKTLKRAQQQLGDLHDRQTLADVVDAARASNETSGALAEEYATLLAWVHADIRRLYDEYANGAREDLQLIVRDLPAHAKRDRARRWLAVGAFAAPSVVYWLSRRQPAPQPSSSLRTTRPADCAATVS
jgi:CHAD domain-containing protein